MRLDCYATINGALIGLNSLLAYTGATSASAIEESSHNGDSQADLSDFYNKQSSSDVFANDSLIDSSRLTLTVAGWRQSFELPCVVHVHLRLRGGKGGFGQLLRAFGKGIEKTRSKEACRFVTQFFIISILH